MQKIIIVFSATLFLFAACVKKEAAFEKVVAAQLQRYPAMQIEDLYKLVYQAALGNEHLMTDSAMVHDYLIKELASIDTSSVGPLWEEISPDGEVVRLNLRPFKARQGDHRALLHAMMQTARNFQRSPERLEQYWRDLEQMAKSGVIAFDAAAMQSFFREMREKGFPAVHHSTVYAENYAPAYRVILKQYTPDIE
ncbi:MAG: hypothetical protein ALAOOOJD_02056 [bacterium]|nr:hypothetical protein [bacterium]